MGAVADGGGTRAQWDPVAQVHRRGHASHVHTGQPCQLRAARCASEQWQNARQARDCWGHPPQQRPECWHQGVEPAQGKAWAAGRWPRFLGAWSTVPPQGPRCEAGAPGPPGALFAHSLLSPPLPGWRMPQAWADVACSPKHTHICPFGPRHQQEERGSWRKGRRPLPREGALPTLGVRAYMTVHCRASCRPAHFVILAWALTCGCRWPSAAPGLAHSLELTRGLCVRLAGLRLTEDFPSWFGGGPAPWQETANIVH